MDRLWTLLRLAPSYRKAHAGACRMTFERLWALLLLPLPLAWVAWEWRRQIRHNHLLLKAAMALAVIFALAEPVLSIHDRKVALAVLVDTSASVSDADLSRENGLLRQMN